MERNYVGQGGYSGNAQGAMISSGRRAGTMRPSSGEDTGYSPSGSDVSGSHVPRFGRRASPGGTPTGGGMEMDPPKYMPASRPAAAAAIPRGPPPGPGPSAAAGSAGAAGGGGGMSSKLAGLQRLKEASNARLASRIPSANGRSGGDAGYVPSAMSNAPPARTLPARTNSGGRSGSSGISSGGGGYGSFGGAAPSARSASTGPAMAAAGRPSSGRSTGPGAPPAPSRPSYGSSSAASAAGARGGAANYGGSASGSSRQQPAAAPAAAPVAARRPVPAAAPPPQPAARAPPPPPASQHHHHHQHQGGDEYGYSGGGGFGGGGGGFGGGGGGFGSSGALPPEAMDPDAVGPSVQCPTCGRNFNEQAYSKHAKICEKVFATKRKPVNMAAKRLEGSEAVKFFDLKKGMPKSEAKPAAAAPGRGPAARAAGLDDRPLPGSKLPKWKAQSEQLRAAMAANRQIVDAKAAGKDIKDIKFAAAPSVPDDRVQCPHCGRKFAELTAERHIPKCKDIMAKPKSLAAGSGRGAHMRR